MSSSSVNSPKSTPEVVESTSTETCTSTETSTAACPSLPLSLSSLAIDIPFTIDQFRIETNDTLCQYLIPTLSSLVMEYIEDQFNKGAGAEWKQQPHETALTLTCGRSYLLRYIIDSRGFYLLHSRFTHDEMKWLQQHVHHLDTYQDEISLKIKQILKAEGAWIMQAFCIVKIQTREEYEMEKRTNKIQTGTSKSTTPTPRPMTPALIDSLKNPLLTCASFLLKVYELLSPPSSSSSSLSCTHWLRRDDISQRDGLCQWMSRDQWYIIHKA